MKKALKEKHSMKNALLIMIENTIKIKKVKKYILYLRHTYNANRETNRITCCNVWII